MRACFDLDIILMPWRLSFSLHELFIWGAGGPGRGSLERDDSGEALEINVIQVWLWCPYRLICDARDRDTKDRPTVFILE